MDLQLSIELGRGLAFTGAAFAFALGGCGSAKGINIAAQEAAGVLSEKPGLFGRLLVMVALPGTQGFYGFVVAFLMAVFTGLQKGQVMVTPGTGLAFAFVGLGCGLALYVSAVNQGQASAAGIALIGRREDAAGRALLFPALVETYAVVALLASVFFILWLTASEGSNVLEFLPAVPEQVAQ